MTRSSLLLVLLLSAPVWGQRTTDRSARELLLEAACTVVVEPAGKEASKVKVVEVLRGARVKVGDVLDGPRLAALLNDERGPAWANLGQAVLFGTLPEKPSESFELLPTGVRLVTKPGKVWQMASRTGGGFRLLQRPEVEWPRLLGRLRGDVAELAALEALRQQAEGPRRNRALLAWLERHPPAKLAAPPLTSTEPVPGEDLADGGWGAFETEPVRWILRTGSAEDSWTALALYARLHEGALVGRECYPFATVAGRALLLEKVKDENGLGGDALRSLRMLGWAETYPQRPVPAAAFARPVTAAEQERLLTEVRALLGKKDGRWKQAAAEALVALVGARATAEEARQAVVTDLQAQFETAKPGTTRNVLARALFRIAPGGKPLALLLDLGKRDHKLYFWLGVYPEGSLVKEVPTLLIEKVLPAGKFAKALEMPLRVAVAPDWMAGWDTRRPLFVEVPVGRLPAGQSYRMTVSGVVGPEKTKFTSEARTFKVAPAVPPNQPGTLPRIVLDEE